jgi:hypothetical protein
MQRRLREAGSIQYLVPNMHLKVYQLVLSVLRICAAR